VRSEVHEQKAIKGGKKDSSSRGCTNTSSNASNAAFLKEEQAQKPKARFPRGADEKAQRSPSETSNSSLRSGDSSPRSPKQTGVPKVGIMLPPIHSNVRCCVAYPRLYVTHVADFCSF
jgi:hypothetical protein